MTVSSNPSSILGVNITLTDTVRRMAVGTHVMGDYGGEWLYAVASAAIAAGDWVILSKDYAASLATTTNSPKGAKVGIARAAMASGEYGWIQVGGQAPGRTAGAVAANAAINTTATGGAVDDDATSGAKVINGVAIPVAAGGATTATEFTLTDPTVGATL